ncbi:MAG TPA: endolytic transglycosylase MltG, partial [Hyphomicrobiaceae bacterium]|nr:endolytic transglycosylase MltG [Hyphomicrobiaceae bacterium]
HIDKREEISLMLKDVIADVRATTKGKQRPQQLAAMERRFYLAGTAPAEVVKVAPPTPSEKANPVPEKAAPAAPVPMVKRVQSAPGSDQILTIEPGLQNEQVIAVLLNESRLSGEITKAVPEGTLLPGPYAFKIGDTRQSFLDDLVLAQKLLLRQFWKERATLLPYKSEREAVILASIVEKEAGRADQREMIAAVFINRLKKGMKLQSDPTVMFGRSSPPDFTRPLTKADIEAKTAYNTYVIDGLPPEPIANPSYESIKAAFNPAATKALFFAPDGAGGHVFSETLKEHQAAVAKWRRIAAAAMSDKAAAMVDKGAVPVRKRVIITLKGIGAGVESKAAIAAAQDEVIRDLGLTGDAVVRRFDLLPQLVLLLAEEALAKVRAHPRVARVDDDLSQPLPAPVPSPGDVNSPKKAQTLGYVAVLVSRASHLEALKALADLHAAYPDILGGKSLTVVEARIPTGVWHRVIAGPPGSMETAREVCTKLKAKGYSGCFTHGY